MTWAIEQTLNSFTWAAINRRDSEKEDRRTFEHKEDNTYLKINNGFVYNFFPLKIKTQ